ncbi:MAG TPA: hypothetical protein DCE56_36100 [Cyanobacteria bacterium UBA8553]|nr:hypothetical protein [Cyanobacteria bacterium UBA8553]HAJ62020.1 hypothetical protein [Cyanobacteria bacterium UBA8543]
MTKQNDKSLQIQEIIGLKQTHFADLIRAAQLIFDPGGGVSGRNVEVDWQELGIPVGVEENLRAMGERYRYSSPHVPVETIWEQLTPESRSWFLENKDDLWQIEEAFPALDED